MRWIVLAIACSAAGAVAAEPRVLRVCADPNNLPFSSEAAPGFENELAALIARELGARLEYTWWPQRRGFVRQTLGADRCDVVMGVPAGFELVRTTAPYYRSTFAFVTRADRQLDVRSFDDARLRTLRVGVPLVGDDGANPAPAHVLARRGIVHNVVGFPVYGDYAQASPAAAIVRAVADGTIDVAILWGPLAGGAARASDVRLRVTPIAEPEVEGVQLAFSIALGVRKRDRPLAEALDRVLVARRAEIAKVLARWGVPQLPLREERGPR